MNVDLASTESDHFWQRDECPACGGAGAEVVYSRPYAAHPVGTFLRQYYRKLDETWLRDAIYEVARCPGCRCVFQRYVPDDRLLAEVYGKWISDADDGPLAARRAEVDAQAHPRFSKQAQHLAALSRAIGRPLRGLRILDWGMGWGLWALTAQRMGARVHGLELDPVRCRFAASLGVTVIDEASLPAGGYDLIYTEQVLEHLARPAAMLSACKRALAPGGVVHVSVPRSDRIVSLLQHDENWLRCKPYRPPIPYHGVGQNRVYAIAPLEHLNCFHPKSLRALGERTGLRVRAMPLGARFAPLWRGMVDLRDLRGAARAVARPVFDGLIRRTNQVALLGA
jgi:SAM-dependent methyltransferase